jgi:hypothetical protein
MSSLTRMQHVERRSPLLLLVLSLFLSISLVLVFPPSPVLSAPVPEKTINVAMSATWPSTPLLIETSEHLASIDAAHYWTFLDLLSSHFTNTSTSSSSSPLTDAALHQLSLTLSSQILGHASMEVLSSVLALHSHSVKAQLYHTLLNNIALTYTTGGSQSVADCAVVVQYAGRLGCDVSVMDVNEASSDTVYDFDHVYPEGGAVNRTVILYADLTTLHQNEAHQQLVTLVSNTHSHTR